MAAAQRAGTLRQTGHKPTAARRAAGPSPAAPLSARERTVNETRRHILLIDDDLDMHTVVTLILQPAGYRVTCCATGQAGLAVVRNDRPDLVLLDVMLATPTEGLEVAQQIRAHPATRDVPIVVVSSTTRDFDLHAGGLENAIDLFVEKPLEAQQLRQVVGDVLLRGPAGTRP